MLIYASWRRRFRLCFPKFLTYHLSMRSLPGIVSLLFAFPISLLTAQGTKPREDPAKYSAHTQIGSIGFGADFWGHSVPIEDGALKTDSYLVVEVALFAPPSAKLVLSASQFVLKVNGQRLTPNSPGLGTIGSLIPDMRNRGPRLETQSGVGPITVSTGRDPAQPKFPGDSNPADIPLPPQTQPSDGIQKEPIDPVKAVSDAALPEGPHATPISGYLFYLWTGKLKRIKSAEIEYTGPIGTATLSLR